MIVLDTKALVKLTLLDPRADQDALRLKCLLDRSSAGGIAVGVPAPVFAEFLVRADDATSDILSAFEKKSLLRILPFDKRAGHECAILDRTALDAGDKRSGTRSPWQKVKVDRQIIAIARVHGARELITDDRDLTALANLVGLTVTKIESLPIADAERQQDLEFVVPARAES